jgi:hypothetical protein
MPRAFSPQTTLFGVEIEFPVASLDSVNALRRAHDKFTQKVKDKCDLCPESCHTAKGNIVHLRDGDKTPNGITFMVSMDPGVIEVKTPPLTYGQMESWQVEIEELIFATARDLHSDGFLMSSETERNRWSGHINVSWPGLSDAREFYDGESMNLLLNYFIDLQNFPELGMGVLGGDVRNAAPLAFGSAEDQKRLLTTINLYRQGAFQDLKSLARNLYEVYPSAFNGYYAEQRYSLMNLASVASMDGRWGYEKGTRIELRGFFAPTKVDDMLSNLRIINARLEFLRTHFPAAEKKVVDYRFPKMSPHFIKNATLETHQTSGLIAGLSPELAAKSYITYLRESGIDPQHELKYLRDKSLQNTVRNQLRCGN